jgi:hypothetical protein
MGKLFELKQKALQIIDEKSWTLSSIAVKSA